MSKHSQDDFCMFDGMADEVLLFILGNLSTRDRWSMSRTCRRFQALYNEKKLWTRVDVPPELENHETVEHILKSCINSRTRFLRITGTSHGSQIAARNSVQPSLLLEAISNINKRVKFDDSESDTDSDESSRQCKRRKIALDSLVPTKPEENYANLVELHLIRQKLDGRFVNLREFPTSLRVLNLSGTSVSAVTESSGYFRDISFYLVNLEDLNMNDCTWITSHALLALSKLPSLLKLSLKGCRGIGNCIAYVSLAMRLGFRKLKILDVTNTRFRGPDIDCSSYLPCLEEFYVGEYDKFDTSIDYYSLSMDINFGYFRDSPTLKVIDISGCVVTDNIFETFASLPNICKIIAHFTNLSKSGIKQFKKFRPSCIIEKEEESCELGS